MEVDGPQQPCSSNEPDCIPVDANSSSATCEDSPFIGPLQLPSMEVEPYVAQDVPTSDGEPGVCGLYNLGNTCYMNSALQCLFHDLCLKEQFLDKINRSKEDGLFLEFVDIFSKYWSGNWSSIVPRKFKQAIGLTHTQFEGCGQHDGQEFLALFLASLHQELKRLTGQTKCKEVDSDTCASSTSTSPDDKNSNRKRAGSNVDNSMPNNKRVVEASSLNQQYLTLTSFIGKEKKTANVNVLNTDTECDEEITTDHSNKFPQTAFRLNSDTFVGDVELNNQSRPRHKSSEGSNFVEQIKDLKLRQLKEPNCKQTNVIADIKRHVEKEYSDLKKDVDPSCTSDCKTISTQSSPNSSDKPDRLACDAGKHFTPEGCSDSAEAVKLHKEEIALLSSALYDHVPSQSKIAQDKFNDILPKALEVGPSHLFRAEQPSTDDVIFKNLKSGSLIPKKLFSLNKAELNQLPFAKQDIGDKDIEKMLPSHQSAFLSKGDAPPGELQLGEQKVLPVDKLNNEFVDEKEAPTCADRKSLDVVEGEDEDPQELTSNIRGDICGSSSGSSTSEADEIWLKYTEENKSVIVDNLQGQLESTVVCCKCSHKSTTYEPFMYLSVPIPHALQRSFSIKLFPLSGEPTEHSVFVLKEGQMQDLREALDAKLKENGLPVDLSTYSFCETKDFSILKVLENTMMLKSVNTSSRNLQAIEFLNKVSEETEDKADEGKSSWNSCCICLEDLSDPELLRHSSESCSVLMCQTCLQTSTQHYGVDNFTCPMCHLKCSPATDFVQLASSNQSRDVVVSVSFVCEGDNRMTFLAPSRVLRISTTLSGALLHKHVQQLMPKSTMGFSDFQLMFSTLDGASCSRCDVTTMCTGCFVVPSDSDDVTLHPGDNICVRFPLRSTSQRTFPPIKAIEHEELETSVTLEMCLNAFTKKEILDSRNPWFCPSCDCHQMAEKRLKVCRWPSTLIVYIKRFLYHSKTAVKVDDEVLFPVESFNPGPMSATEEIHSKLYDLNSCVSHHGGVYSGHYTSCCKHPTSGKWHLYNDENVSVHEPSSKDAAGVYILFYKERNTNFKKNELRV